MSHLKERSEKKCLNCNTDLDGRYCHVCGQENLEPEETAWHLVTHFFNDITHFDGKFFSTLKCLIFKPGFLSSEYKMGRRASYLNPVRMYIFTSAIFFLIFFSVTHIGDGNVVKKTYNKKTPTEIDKMDSLQFDAFTRELNDEKPMTRAEFEHFKDTVKQKTGLHFSTKKYRSKEAYDSARKAGKIDDGWFERQMAYKEIEMNEKYEGNQDRILRAFVYNLFHSLPQMLFLSLPLFALVLKLLYIRRKHFYYVSHAIFSIQFYIFVFIMWFIALMLQQLNDILDWNFIICLQVGVVILIFFYLYKAMRNFYQQRRAKTIWKYLLLNFSMFFIICLLFVVFVFFSLMKT